jgi:hypothetical protein
MLDRYPSEPDTCTKHAVKYHKRITNVNSQFLYHTIINTSV